MVNSILRKRLRSCVTLITSPLVVMVAGSLRDEGMPAVSEKGGLVGPVGPSEVCGIYGTRTVRRNSIAVGGHRESLHCHHFQRSFLVNKEVYPD